MPGTARRCPCRHLPAQALAGLGEPFGGRGFPVPAAPLGQGLGQAGDDLFVVFFGEQGQSHDEGDHHMGWEFFVRAFGLFAMLGDGLIDHLPWRRGGQHTDRDPFEESTRGRGGGIVSNLPALYQERSPTYAKRHWDTVRRTTPLFPRLGARSVIRSRSVRTWWDSTLYLVGKRMSEYGRNRMLFSWGSCPWWHRCVHEVSHPQGAPPRDGEGVTAGGGGKRIWPKLCRVMDMA